MDIIIYDFFTILSVAISQSLTLTRLTQWMFRVNRSGEQRKQCGQTNPLEGGRPQLCVVRLQPHI
jgi:hypothetical protein